MKRQTLVTQILLLRNSLSKVVKSETFSLFHTYSKLVSVCVSQLHHTKLLNEKEIILNVIKLVANPGFERVHKFLIFCYMAMSKI